MSEGDSAIRDLLVAFAVVAGILLALFLYTGNWPPPVVVESNSMMHVDQDEYVNNFGDTRAEEAPFGRVGTIDPGDLVLVKDVDDIRSIPTFADEEESHYSRSGEVLVYFPGGDRQRTPIIHRAMTYVEVHERQDGPTQYEVRWHSDWDRNVGCEDENDRECTEPGDCEENERGRLVCTFEGGFRLPDLLRRSGQHVYRPAWSGFITQGDNPENHAPDQILFPDRGPIKEDWAKGVARAELPWFGLIKLAVTGNPANTADVQDHPYFVSIGAMTAPQDLWIMLVVGLGVVAFAPVGVDYGIHLVRRRLTQPSDPPPEEPPEAVEGSDAGHPPPDEDGDRVDIDIE
jgi:signal peptidase